MPRNIACTGSPCKNLSVFLRCATCGAPMVFQPTPQSPHGSCRCSSSDQHPCADPLHVPRLREMVT